MSELFWPGDGRAGALLTDEALLAAMSRVEIAWLHALHTTGVATDVELDFSLRIGIDDIADDVEAGGNPVIPLVAVLRDRLPDGVAEWLHRGLTSQDTLDSALMLCLRDVLDQVLTDVHRQVETLRALADAHRDSIQAGRTLTQHAVPTTFGLTAANWLAGVLDAAEDLAAVRTSLPAQVGGAAGTLAAPVALAGSPEAAQQLVEEFAAFLQLSPAPPWHTNRRPITRVGDALVAGVDAWGRIANDVLIRTRPELAELSEAAPGGSSTMPHKQNPVLSILVKRAALNAPFLAAQLHAAAAAAVDERPDGAWHAEWAPLQTLGRLAVVAASQTADLLAGLVVHTDRMRSTAEAAAADLLAERDSFDGEVGRARVLPGRDGPVDRSGHRAGRSVRAGRPMITDLALTDLGGSGPTLLLGPSLGTTSASLWSAAAALLADRFHLVTWDLPGHGECPPAGEFTVTEIAAALLGTVDRAFGYAGVSLGGAVGLQLLLDAPERVRFATLLSTGARIGEPAGWQARAERVRREGLAWLVAEMPPRWFAPANRTGAAAQALLDDLARVDPESYAAACDALGRFDVRTRLGEITSPVLAVAGAHDPVTTPDTLRQIADGVRHGRLAVLDDAGHQSPAEVPADVARLIRASAEPAPDDTSLEQLGAAGMQVRREVLGDAHVDRASASADGFTTEFQELITRYAWGGIWTRPGLDRRTRSFITLTALVAGGHHEELALHLRGALRNGVTRDEIKELLLQTAIYCGVPSANTAFRIAQKVLAEDEQDGPLSG